MTTAAVPTEKKLDPEIEKLFREHCQSISDSSPVIVLLGLGWSGEQRAAPECQVAVLSSEMSVRVRGRLSIKLCLSRQSSGLLEAGLKHGVELGQGGENGASAGSPAAVLQGTDRQPQLKKGVGLHYSRFQKAHVDGMALIGKIAPKLAKNDHELRKSG